MADNANDVTMTDNTNDVSDQVIPPVENLPYPPDGTDLSGDPFVYWVRNCKPELGDIPPNIRYMAVVAESLGEPFNGTISFDERLGPIINGLDKLDLVFRPPFYPDHEYYLSIEGPIIDDWQDWIAQIIVFLGKHLREDTIVEVDNGHIDECESLDGILDEHFTSGYVRTQEGILGSLNRAYLSLSWDYHPDDFKAVEDYGPLAE